MNSGIPALSSEPHGGLPILQIVGCAAGLLILGGLWTPVAGVLAGIVEVWIAFSQPGSQSVAIILATLGISLAMIGPGAWSVDARLYGRKQLLPPEPWVDEITCRRRPPEAGDSAITG